MSKPKLNISPLDPSRRQREEEAEEAEAALRLQAVREVGPGPRHNPRRPPAGIVWIFQATAHERLVREKMERLRGL